jgi:CHAT domain-containing protein/tetratricopeptide (TPR) repeat protein
MINRHSGLRLFLLWGLVFLATDPARTSALPACPRQNAQVSAEDVRELAPEASIEREIRRGEVHSYRIKLQPGNYMEVTIGQQSIDIWVKVLGPGKQPVVEVDGERLAGRVESIFVLAETEGEHRFEIRPVEGYMTVGSYRIRVEALRTATAEDQNRVSAQRSFSQARELQRQGGADALRKAADKFQESLALWKTLNNGVQQARALNHIGLVYMSLRDYAKAVDYYNQALPVWKSAGDAAGEAGAVHSIGALYSMMGKHREGIEYLQRALPLWRSANDKGQEGNTLSAIADAYYRLDQYQEAIDYDKKKLQIVRALGDRKAEGVTLHNIGAVYFNIADYPKALEYYNQALPIRLEVGDRDGEAHSLSAIGLVHSSRGDFQKAFEHYERAVLLFREVGNRQGEGLALHNMASAYAYVGERQRALDQFSQSLKLRREVRDRQGEAQTLNQIANVYLAVGDYEKAIETYDLALPIRREAGDRRGSAYTLNGMSNAYLAMGEHQKALDHSNQALSVFQAIGDRDGQPAALANIGRVYSAMGNSGKAIEYYNQSLPLFHAIGSRRLEAETLDRAGAAYHALGKDEQARDLYTQALALSRSVQIPGTEARSLAGLARIESRIGNLAEARVNMETALAKIEYLRTRVPRQDLRATFLASVQESYEFYIDLLMRLDASRPSEGHAAAALEASERARARSLLETLAEARADIRQGVDPALIAGERAAGQRINARSERLTRLLAARHTDQQAEEAKKDLDIAISEYLEMQAQIRTNSPRYSALTEPQPLSVKEIQQQVLDSETMLLEYSLGRDRSYLWALTPSSMASFELPPRAQIEAAARRLHQLIALGDRSELRVQVRLAATTLSRMVLGPVAGQLGNKRLLIVADGALQYVPFAALPVPETSVSTGHSSISRAPAADKRPQTTNRPLIADCEIIVLPSASVLAVLRRETAGRQRSSKTVAILADPVLESNDPRVSRALSNNRNPETEPISRQAAPINAKQDLIRSFGETGAAGFERLIYTRREAAAIAPLAEKNKRLEALDFDASRSRATSPELGEYRIVHFATHGLINSQHPELSGVVLSLVDERGQQQDGFLRLHDVYNLKLGADLVVLSACRTALGKEVKGEGLIGLTRGFMYAGAPRVAASLWDVKDEATAELMKKFYEGMLKRGLPASAALRSAQVSMWRERRWESPYYWAGFVLQGEWR